MNYFFMILSALWGLSSFAGPQCSSLMHEKGYQLQEKVIEDLALQLLHNSVAKESDGIHFIQGEIPRISWSQFLKGLKILSEEHIVFRDDIDFVKQKATEIKQGHYFKERGFPVLWIELNVDIPGTNNSKKIQLGIYDYSAHYQWHNELTIKTANAFGTTQKDGIGIPNFDRVTSYVVVLGKPLNRRYLLWTSAHPRLWDRTEDQNIRFSDFNLIPKRFNI